MKYSTPEEIEKAKQSAKDSYERQKVRRMERYNAKKKEFWSVSEWFTFSQHALKKEKN